VCRLSDHGKTEPESTQVPALEQIWTDCRGQSLATFNFRTVTDKFNKLVYRYPIRIPERYALVIRSLLTQEGICMTLEPDFKFLEVAFPYIAKRLLTDEDPILRERLLQVRTSVCGARTLACSCPPPRGPRKRRPPQPPRANPRHLPVRRSSATFSFTRRANTKPHSTREPYTRRCPTPVRVSLEAWSNGNLALGRPLHPRRHAKALGGRLDHASARARAQHKG
jgi:hypothetical protein